MISLLFTLAAGFFGYHVWQFVYDYETRIRKLMGFLAHTFGAGPNDREIAERHAREFFWFDAIAAMVCSVCALVAL